MLAGLYRAANGIINAERNQEVVAQNLANINRAGYRRSVLSFESFQDSLNNANSPESFRGEPIVGRQSTDFTPGDIERTDRSLDVAVDGDGFLTLQGPTGPLLTRTGTMYVSSDGTLVASNGFPILGEQGPIDIPTDVNTDKIIITPDGELVHDGSSIGKLQAQTVADKSTLEPVGDAMFRASADDLKDADVRFQQGARERSNVSATTELVRMIVGMRHHEAAQRALRSIDSALSQHTQDRGV